MPISTGSHVTFTNEQGNKETGTVDSTSGGKYTIKRANGSTVTLEESKVTEFHPSSQDKDACPVVGHK